MDWISIDYQKYNGTEHLLQKCESSCRLINHHEIIYASKIQRDEPYRCVCTVQRGIG